MCLLLVYSHILTLNLITSLSLLVLFENLHIQLFFVIAYTDPHNQ